MAKIEKSPFTAAALFCLLGVMSCKSREYNSKSDVDNIFDFGMNSASALKNWRDLEPEELIKKVDCSRVRKSAKPASTSAQEYLDLAKQESDLLDKWKRVSHDSKKETGDTTTPLSPVATRVESLRQAERAEFQKTDLELAQVRWEKRHAETEVQREQTCQKIASQDLPIAAGRKKISLSLGAQQDAATKLAELLPLAFEFSAQVSATLEFWKYTENSIRVDDLKRDLVYSVNPGLIEGENLKSSTLSDELPTLSPYAQMLIAVKSAQGAMAEAVQFSEQLSPENFPSVKVEKRESCDAWVDKWQKERGGIMHYWSHRDLYLKLCNGNPLGLLLSSDPKQRKNYCELPVEFRMCFVCNDQLVNKSLDKAGRFQTNYAACKVRLTGGEQTLFVQTFQNLLK